MRLKFYNKKITGILTVLPSKEVLFEEEMENYNFSIAKSMKLKMAMGYNKHRIVEDGVCVSDLCVHGLKYLFDNAMLCKDDIDALLLVTQSPDHFMPATSNVIQGKLGLGTNVFCMDINQGCCGFIIGLIEAFMLLEQESINKVVLLNADVLSRKVSKRDRNSNPLTGDAATITIVEKSDLSSTIHGFLKMDGSRSDALMIPAGGFRLPVTEETGRMVEDASGNFRSLENLVMKGDEVFNFVQREVPFMIEGLLLDAGYSKENVDWYMFHQPNRFMLHKLADKLGVPHEKMPSNIVENFGNSSGATIPTNISFNLGTRLKEERYTFCLAGFGVGLTWGALLLDIGNLSFNDIIYF
ncbi:ketoacyl-ACP synthase III [Parabacteroides goldsteinii]|jgi:3-oxoacyl-[acyl-carrier-protein] synthase-3|uniref:3-oxoacyl-ACP synthase III family protein n=1 Tax=Parabacteroides goldsteinii TaxID=328812 RepID=UPI00189997EE|nr:ketoacyl-ACP synthase III [Parabacteroides goldsteinii]UBD75549.1 ketoacyl-ACP synthase III [Parabacteroides goldsteinii]